MCMPACSPSGVLCVSLHLPPLLQQQPLPAVAVTSAIAPANNIRHSSDCSALLSPPPPATLPLLSAPHQVECI